MKCEKCGQEVGRNDLFCTNCGAKLPERPLVPEDVVSQEKKPEAPQAPHKPVKKKQQPAAPRPMQKKQPIRTEPSQKDSRPSRPERLKNAPQKGRKTDIGYAADDFLKPEQPTEKKGKPVLVIAAAVAAVAVIAGGALWFSGAFSAKDDPAPAPEQVTEAEEQTSEAEAEQTAETAKPAINLGDFYGYWMADSYNNEETSFVGLTFSGDSGEPRLAISQTWAKGEHYTHISPITLTLNEDKTAASAKYTDNHGGTGEVTLNFESSGDMYVTVTGTGDWCISLQREHCTRDPFGAQRVYEKQETAQTQTAQQTQPAQQQTAQSATQQQTTKPATQQPTQAPQVTPDDPNDTMYNYVYSLNDAINANSFSTVAPTLLHGSSAYSEQQTLVTSLAKQGIKENVVSVNVKSKNISGKTAVVVSDELIGVTYADGSYKEIAQSYAYHMQLQSDGSWRIDSMTEQ